LLLNPDAAAKPALAGHATGAPSEWVVRWAGGLPAGTRVLDLACGSGRHLRWLAERGHRVTGVDRDAAAIEPLRGLGEIVVADLEAGAWPLPGRRFDAVVVTNYLWRPLLPLIVDTVAEGGLLIYETFASGQESLGRPARPEFLLRPGELLQACSGLQVLAYEDGLLDAPMRRVQRVCAWRPDPARPQALPPRLDGRGPSPLAPAGPGAGG
jgi:SAM-dependent methyltransferase